MALNFRKNVAPPQSVRRYQPWSGAHRIRRQTARRHVRESWLRVPAGKSRSFVFVAEPPSEQKNRILSRVQVLGEFKSVLMDSLDYAKALSLEWQARWTSPTFKVPESISAPYAEAFRADPVGTLDKLLRMAGLEVSNIKYSGGSVTAVGVSNLNPTAVSGFKSGFKIDFGMRGNPEPATSGEPGFFSIPNNYEEMVALTNLARENRNKTLESASSDYAERFAGGGPKRRIRIDGAL